MWRGSGEGTTWRQPRPASSRIVQPRVVLYLRRFGFVVEVSDGLARRPERGVVGVHLDLGEQAHPRASATPPCGARFSRACISR